MPITEDTAAVRREILELLRQQMEALDSPLGLTDAKLTECYERQARVQELRERLQAATSAQPVVGSTSREASAVEETSSSGAQSMLVSSADTAANL